MKPSTDREAISLIIDGLIERGCKPTVARDGDNDDVSFIEAAPQEFLDWLTSCDESVLFVDLPNGDDAYVYFVLGNEPYEVASDYTVNLEKFLDPIVQPWWE